MSSNLIEDLIKNVKIDSIYLDIERVNLIYASKNYLSTKDPGNGRFSIL